MKSFPSRRSASASSEGSKLRGARLLESLYSLTLLVWCALTLISRSSAVVSSFLLRGSALGMDPPLFRLPVAVAACAFVSLLALFKLSSWFLSPRFPSLVNPRRSFSISIGILQSAVVLFLLASHIFAFARAPRYFLTVSPFLYALFGLSLTFNAYSACLLIFRLNERDVAYREYTRYRREREGVVGLGNLLFRPGIQRRLYLSFLPLILSVVVVFAFMLLRNFSSTILGTMMQNGELLAERTASLIVANPADLIAAEDYLFIEEKKNRRAAQPFLEMAYHARREDKRGFTIVASTDRSHIGMSAETDVTPFDEPGYSYDEVSRVYSFRAPVNLGKAFLGYVRVDYERDIIFEPYFRTQIKVLFIAAAFVYVSLFLIYLIGRNIVVPILSLRLGVASISASLSAMIRGESKISSELLTYHDLVSSKDEIKTLSREVGNMTSVIRGILPYISASTLKHSGRAVPTTERRELCFLFTDIRGFTSLCEGMAAETVVELLNHYLDLQSTIILANHGDVDKFVGDEVMAMFEGPDKEFNACKTGLEIRAAMAAEKEIALAAKKNVVSIGMGINTGPVIFGSVGAKDRMDFTSIGDTVNLAARLEGVNKAYGTKTLITEAVYEKVKDQYLCRQIDLLTVKGRTEPVRIYELLQNREAATDRLLELCAGFESGLAAYRRRDWVRAEMHFSRLRKDFKDEASATFLSRVSLYSQEPPPPEWNGVFKLTVK